ncbi:uncharacterized protein TNCV_2077901 [Trichonephila clavipes]|nr:uncharacterized protein TNCV_2077901 [Trichonephila clavipes]
MVSDGTEFAIGDIEKLFDEARRNTKAKHEKWAKYDRRRHDVQIKVNDWVLVKQNKLVVWRSGKRITVNVDQVRPYHHRKSDEMEIRTSSSDNNCSSFKSNNFEGMQPRSNELQYSRKNGSAESRELDEKGTGLLRRIKVKGTRVLPVITDHLSDYHLVLGQNQIERLKR